MAFTDLTFDSAIADRLARETAGDRNPVFVTEEGSSIYPSDFEQRVSESAAWLTARGIKAGDKVAIWLPNRVEWMILLFGCARIGAVVAAVNTRYRTAELQHILASSGAKMLIYERHNAYTDFHALIEKLDFSKLPALKQLIVTDGDAKPSTAINNIEVALYEPDAALPEAPRAATPDSPVMLFTTSGTTSMPKLVMHLQRTLGLHGNNCASAVGFDKEGARYLAAMPFCGVFGISTTFAAIAGGAPVYLMSQYETKLATQMAKENRITHMFGSDDMFQQIWKTDRSAFAHARICGFASFTPGMEDKLREMATEIPLAGLYGASELNALLSVQPLSLPIEQRLQGGGKATGPEIEIRVRNTETGALCPPNELGVLEFRAPTNFAGYYKNEEATKQAIDQEGFFHSNDAGYLREDGTFVYLARNGDFLRLSGFLTDPKEIEEVIEKNAAVEKCQVVGIEFEGKTRPVAFVIPAGSAATPVETEILANAKASLAHYKVPLHVITLDAFPTTESANGLKIQKAKLRDLAIEHCR